ncbi:MAG: DUF1598 domain-containing protein [Planctomycetaceae bacterium]|nr:DUF1598 domain-containing protein [Planctomycetaceae bacterium]
MNKKFAQRNSRWYSIFARTALIMLLVASLGLLIQGSLNAAEDQAGQTAGRGGSGGGLRTGEFFPGTIYQRAIGGVAVDAQGVLSNVPTQVLRDRSEVLKQHLKAIPGELTQQTALRKVSLKRLNELIARSSEEGTELPDEALYLGGLTSIQNVVAVPEENDILLIGPAEGWKYDQFGCLVGVKTGKPILLLEDLITLVRLWNGNTHPEAMTCSIDPTPEALVRAARLKRNTDMRSDNAQEFRRELEQAFGMNDVTLSGLPSDCRIARVMVAADYKLKQIGLGLPGTPKGIPSYVSRVSLRSNTSLSPRFWLTPEYGTISHDVDRLTWDLSQSKVKVMTESDYIDVRGGRVATGTSQPTAAKYARDMTKSYDDLAGKDSVFADLKNCMELSVAVALIYRENLPKRAGCELKMLWDRSAVDLPRYDVPKQVQSIGVIERKTGGVVVACGGVEVNPWTKLEKTQLNEELSFKRSGLIVMKGDRFWSN